MTNDIFIFEIPLKQLITECPRCGKELMNTVVLLARPEYKFSGAEFWLVCTDRDCVWEQQIEIITMPQGKLDEKRRDHVR